MNRLIFSLLIFTATLSQFAYGANSCESVFLSPETSMIDELFSSRPGRPGGVTNGRVHDQKGAENCWSQTLTALAEAEYFKAQIEQKIKKDPSLDRQLLLQDRSHLSVSLSPQHGFFWHFYFQIKDHLSYFRKKLNLLEKEDPTLREVAIQNTIKEAYGLGRSKKVDTTKAYQPDVANNLDTALQEAKLVGLVPDSKFGIEIQTAEDEAWLESALPRFIGKYVLNKENLDRYKGKDRDGINSALFEDLANFLRPIFPVKPIRPNDTFTYRNRITTPLSFMREEIGFHPEEWVEIISDKKTMDLAIEAISESIDNNIAVPIGVTMLGTVDDQLLRQESGLFSENNCDIDCNTILGGHEMLAVNYVFDEDPKMPEGIIVQNSWGRFSHRDIDGRPTEVKSKQGFFAITNRYLRKTGQIDFVLKKSIANKPKYKGKFY